MNLNLENGWQILPIGGDTDTAYMGIKSDQKVFLKRNTSPFLAALSLEEIAPRLIWTKRISTGDTLTAQEWLMVDLYIGVKWDKNRYLIYYIKFTILLYLKKC